MADHEPGLASQAMSLSWECQGPRAGVEVIAEFLVGDLAVRHAARRFCALELGLSHGGVAAGYHDANRVQPEFRMTGWPRKADIRL